MSLWQHVRQEPADWKATSSRTTWTRWSALRDGTEWTTETPACAIATAPGRERQEGRFPPADQEHHTAGHAHNQGQHAGQHLCLVLLRRAAHGATGVEKVQAGLPENAEIWIGAIDEELNSKSYIVPGLGDAGDLAFGVKLSQ